MTTPREPHLNNGNGAASLNGHVTDPLPSAATTAPTPTRKRAKNGNGTGPEGTKPRRAALGDIGPVSSPSAVESAAVRERVAAVQEAQVAAVEGMLGVDRLSDPDLLRRFESVLQGASPDDLRVLREALLDQDGDSLPVSADDELALN